MLESSGGPGFGGAPLVRRPAGQPATREEGHEDKHDAPRRLKPPPPQPELFQLYEEELGGGRPAPLPEVAGWQSQVQRHTAEQILDAPVPQVVDQPEDLLTLFDISVPEGSANGTLSIRSSTFQFVALVVLLAMDVFKVFFPEQSYFHGLLPSRSSTSPISGARGSSGYGCLQGFHPRTELFSLPAAEQIIDIPAPCGGLQDLLPDQGSAASSAVLPDDPFQGFFFALFPGEKSVRVAWQVSAGVVTMLATCGPGPPRTLGWTLIGSLGNLDTQHTLWHQPWAR